MTGDGSILISGELVLSELKIWQPLMKTNTMLKTKIIFFIAVEFNVQ
ncbi:hypothetical protein CYPRO_3290 [Cyclonatronum proteinivorum]|uniref:Uncharacterized protein n=1 Tax=Cyclonatronum proteinivorum TaxID=1457365 RepID=A0A345UPX1_9BACT|nr:hypothetical protein CYPRO_3290 [Cyclonatronum proteinivorum]